MKYQIECEMSNNLVSSFFLEKRIAMLSHMLKIKT